MKGTDHLQNAASALDVASRSLEAAVERFELLLEGGAAHRHAALLLFTAVSLRSLLQTHVEPARRTLEALTADAPPDDGPAPLFGG